LDCGKLPIPKLKSGLRPIIPKLSADVDSRRFVVMFTSTALKVLSNADADVDVAKGVAKIAEEEEEDSELLCNTEGERGGSPVPDPPLEI